MTGIRSPGGGRQKGGLAVGDDRITAKPKIPRDLLHGKHAEDAWHSNLGIMFERKSFSSEDIPHLINYCNAISKVIKIESQLEKMYEFTDVTASGGLKLHPLVNAHNIFTNQAIKLANTLGLTPMARARIISGTAGTGNDDNDDDFDEF